MNKDDDSAKHELLSETKKLVEEMIANPEYAEKAVHDRNIIIRGLKAEISHNKVIYKEVDEKYDMFIEKIDQLEKLIAYNKTLYVDNSTTISYKDQELIKLREDLSNLKREFQIENIKNDQVWVLKLEKLTKDLQGWQGGIVRIMCSRPVSQYLFLIIFCILVVASFTGWGLVAHALIPIIHMFK
jgi:hypothetical protein